MPIVIGWQGAASRLMGKQEGVIVPVKILNGWTTKKRQDGGERGVVNCDATHNNSKPIRGGGARSCGAYSAFVSCEVVLNVFL